MPKLFDRVKFNTSTTGMGTITIGSVSSSMFYLPSEVGAADGDTVRYIIVDGTDVEEGVGTIGGGVTTMARTTVSQSKVSGVAGTSKLNLSGTAIVALSLAAADVLNPANNLADVASAATARTNLGLGTAAVRADTDFPRTDVAQSLTSAVKAQARSNIGLSSGTAGQALYSNGAGADPTFKSGAWVLLNTVTASNSAALSDTTSITSAYTEYEIVLENVLPATTSNTLQLQVQVGGSFQSSNYFGSNLNGTSSSATSESQTSGIPLTRFGSIVNSGPGLSGRYLLSNPGATLASKWIYGQSAYTQGSAAQITLSAGGWNGGSGAITGIQVLTDASPGGNLTSGVMKIYGRVN